MASNEDEVPVIEGLTEEKLAEIRAAIGVSEEEIPPDSAEPVVIEQPIKRKRGRPRKHPLPENVVTEPDAKPTIISPAPLSKKDEREVSVRLQGILIGGTGLASQVKPYLQMTEEEAKAIADPLSSYLVRNADTIPIAQQVLENYDLLAIVLGVLAYTVRVYRERADELAELKRNNPQRTLSDRVVELTKPSSNGQEQGGADFISTPYGQGYGSGS